MKKEEIYFGEKGLTTTSANHLANIAKEMYQELETKLNNINFISKTISLINSDVKKTISTGLSTEEVNSLPTHIQKIGELKSLIAWLREAISIKEELIREARNKDYEVDEPKPLCPERPDNWTFEDFLKAQEPKTVYKYITLEAQCANLGKYIHPDGSYAKARKTFLETLSTPISVRGEGTETVLTESTASVPTEIVESIFFLLQKNFREKQAEFNKIKYDLEKAMLESNRIASETYQIAYKAYGIALKQYELLKENKKEKEIQRISNLKIVIPDALQDIYKEVNSLVG